MKSSFPIVCTGVTSSDNGLSGNLSIQASTDYNVSVSCEEPPQVGPGCSFDPILTGQFMVSYSILSVLYAAPGNASSNGFSSATSNGTTTSISQTFAEGTTTVYDGSASVFGVSAGVSFGISQSSGEGASASFQVTYQQGSGDQILSNRQAIDHTQDQIFLWLNPQVTLTADIFTGAPNGATYTVGPPTGLPMDILNVNVAGLQNPSMIPLETLLPQTPEPGVTLPGLANICLHHLPPSECTQQNACGCVPSDFTAILAADPLIGKSETTPPSQIGTNRYTLLTFEPLEGPQQQGAEPVRITYNITDSNVTSETFTQTTSETDSYTTTSGINIPFLFSFSMSNTDFFTWTNSQSEGGSSGTAHTATVTLGSSNVDCMVDVDIYEDTVYHTFAFAYAQTPPTNCQD